MNLNIFVGLFFSVLAIYLGAPDVRNDITVYLQLNAFLLVFLGTFGSTLISTSFSDFRGLYKLFLSLFFGKKRFLSPVEAIKVMVDLSDQIQHVSRQALPDKVIHLKDLYLSRSMDMVAAGLDKEFVLDALETDIDELRNRHSKKISTVRTMGSFAPMFGMAGTVIGVIQVLKNVTDIENIVAGMALALLTTLYGLIFTSIFFIPLANKLQSLSEEEVLSKQIISHGTEMVLDKEIPLKVEKYLTAYLESSQQDMDLKKK
ncbi:hypothetical protein DID74_02250 [Candidatus Marinamargulisbacteria bacterium SCGC AG-333-B06]|nr:hypothetical protein DID74_02250 [Candidatus Marinamargulisbacteria bacterium SCGC AG-333-B06]